jgi:hypothetical protein
MRTQTVESTTETLNRHEVADFLSRLGRRMAHMGDALLDKQVTFDQASLKAYFLRCPWVTSGTYELTQPWGSAVDRDGLDAIFMKSSWLTQGKEPLKN